MINVLVTGSNGQVGSEIQTLSPLYKYNFYFTDKYTLDISDKEALKKFIQANKINVIINTAAYTNVDKAEEESNLADMINHIAVGYLADIARIKDISLVHISTDYVFDGKNYRPYIENDTTNPSSVYGTTKLAGEKVVLDINPKNSIIIRTSWVYSSFGKNFVKTMLRLGKEKESLGVVFDQVGTPTYAKDLAKVILDILPEIKNDNIEIYHYSNEGVCSWYDFAKEIMRIAKIKCEINPIETKEYPTPATRPYYSLLNKVKIKKDFKINIPYWKNSLYNCLKTLKQF